MANIALIAAAGNGERINCPYSKMLVKIMGKPLLSYTLDQFEKSPLIDQIVLVVRKRDNQSIQDEVLQKNKYRKIAGIVYGGLTRQESVFQGLETIKEKEGIVCIHDGDRPLVKTWMIEETIKWAAHFDGALLAVPVNETIKKVLLSTMIVEKTVNRDELWIAQTPQSFRLSYIKELHQRAQKEGLKVTDDASIVEYYAGEIKIIPSSRENIKVATPVDLALAEVLAKKVFERENA